MLKTEIHRIINSISESDQELCNIFTFYCGNDFNRIDVLFFQSGLYREKWNIFDYKIRAINKSISNRKNTFSKHEKQTIKMLKAHTISSIKKTSHKMGETKFIITCPILSKYICENSDYLFVK